MILGHPISTAALVVSALVLGTPADPGPVVPARDLIKAVAANELMDRSQERKWMYLINKRVGNRTITEEQVETAQGPLYRVRAIDGVPLTRIERQKDDERIDGLLRDPSRQLQLKQQHDDDEKKLENLLRLMPEAFLYEYDGVDGSLARLKFRPDPNYDPQTYEARVVHSLAGTILIDLQQKRLAKLSGQILSQVDFGFGFLGHIDKGGTVEMGRVRVGPEQWKTALINIQLSGRLVFFKTIDKQEYETRSNFRAVPGDLSLSAGRELLGR